LASTAFSTIMTEAAAMQVQPGTETMGTVGSA
jgi:hypothetical protein